jgi:hypothetical protein
VCVVEMRAHHRPQHAAAPMRRRNTDDRCSGALQSAARHRHSKRERSGAAHDLAVLPRGMHPFEREHAREALHSLWIRFVPEVLPDRQHCAAELGKITGWPDFKRHRRSLTSEFV